MSRDSDQREWQSYPMSPRVGQWLGLPPQDPDDKFDDTPANKAGVMEAIYRRIDGDKPENPEIFVGLLEDLLQMDMPIPLLKLAQTSGPALDIPPNYQTELYCGVAAMRIGQQDLAKAHLQKAQEIAPSEPASYINMAQLLMDEADFAAAIRWAKEGLRSEPNHFGLWSLFEAACFHDCECERDKSCPCLDSELADLAKTLNSWAGQALISELAPGDPIAKAEEKAELLQGFYDAGERSEAFLIEFTGVLGIIGKYDKITQVIWQSSKDLGRTPGWQLLMHGAQAYIASDRIEEFRTLAERMRQVPNIPTDVLKMLSELEAYDQGTTKH